MLTAYYVKPLNLHPRKHFICCNDTFVVHLNKSLEVSKHSKIFATRDETIFRVTDDYKIVLMYP